MKQSTFFTLTALAMFTITTVFSQWRFKPPSPAQGNAAATVAGKIYLFGGDNTPLAEYSSSLEVYDTSNGSWATKSSMPSGKHSLAGIQVNGKVYAIGGHAVNSVSTNYQYDPTSNTWTSKASMPIAKSHFGVASLGDTIFVTGGNASGSISRSVEAYIVSSNTWITRASLPASRYTHPSAAVAGRVYVIGGSSQGVVDGAVLEYSPSSNTWTPKASQLTATYGSATCALGGKLYVIGGGTSSGYVTRKVQIYNPTSNSWSYGDSLLIGRYDPKTVVLGNTIYVLGGTSMVGKSAIEALSVPGVTGGIAPGSALPETPELRQNYPNPFNPSTIIRVSLPTQTHLEIRIYDGIGKLVRTLVDAEFTTGDHQVVWDGKNNSGVLMSSGTYFYQLRTGNFVQAKKMLYIK